MVQAQVNDGGINLTQFIFRKGTVQLMAHLPLNFELKEGEAEWMNMLVTMSKSTSKSGIEFDFEHSWVSDLTVVQAGQLMKHLQLHIEGLMWEIKHFSLTLEVK